LKVTEEEGDDLSGIFLIWTTELHPSQNTRVPVVVFLVLVSVDPQHKQTSVITNRLMFVIFKVDAFGF